MDSLINKLIKTVIFFFTPEDSTNTTSILSFDIPPNTVNLGSIKALFWIANILVFVLLINVL